MHLATPLNLVFFFFVFIHLFIFDCPGSLWLWRGFGAGFFWLWQAGATLWCGTRSSQCGACLGAERGP